MAWAFLLLPLVYYGVAAHARFRHPLEPLMVVLGVYLFQSARALTKIDGKRKIRELGTKPAVTGLRSPFGFERIQHIQYSAQLF